MDCGSTTTKAALFALNADGRLALVDRRDAPTTVEAPFEDVTIGVRQAVSSLEQATGWRLLRPGPQGGFITPGARPRVGVDLVAATSSAGGGLRVLVAGVMRAMTAESAERAALGAGAIVSEVIAVDDGRRPHEKLERIRLVEPDMILLAGGVDGGNVSHVAGLAELIFTAGMRPRFAQDEADKLPIVFAGNQDAAGQVRGILGSGAVFSPVPNLRPRLEREDVLPAKREMQELFMRHVMVHAPNYREFVSWVDAILPTPAAVGAAVQMVAQSLGDPVLAVDVGGATTDVFSVYEGRLYRSTSANLGLSYSALNLLTEAGPANIRRWLDWPFGEDEFADSVANKTVRPTTLPETPEDLALEQAMAREALRLSLARHQETVVGLRGVHQERDLSNVFDQPMTGQPLVSLARLKAIIGSGGVLSHAPQPWQAAAILVDGLEPRGVTQLYLDRGFLFPHVGAVAELSPGAAREMLFGQALVPLGTVVSPTAAPTRRGPAPGEAALGVCFTPPGEDPQRLEVAWGELRVVPLPAACQAKLELKPLAATTDAGAGPGAIWSGTAAGGAAGVIIDARGRPLPWSKARAGRSARDTRRVSRPTPAAVWTAACRRAGLTVVAGGEASG